MRLSPSDALALHAGGGLSSLNSIHQCAAGTFIRSEHQPKCLSHSPDLACDHICRRRRAGVLAKIGISAIIKIHIALAASRCSTARDFVPWRFLDAGQLSLRNVFALPASKNQHRSRHRCDFIHYLAGG